MKRLQITGIVLAVLFITGVVVVIVSVDSEPRYQGRTLSDWLGQAMNVSLKAKTPEEVKFYQGYMEAKNAINQMGSNAIPFLVDDLMIKDLRPRSKMEAIIHNKITVRIIPERWLRSLEQALLIPSTDIMERNTQGYLGFVLLEENGRAARPALLKMIKETKADERDLPILIFSYAATKPPKEEFLPIVDELMTNSEFTAHAAALAAFGKLYPDEAK